MRTSIERVSFPAPTGDEGPTALAAMDQLTFEDVYKTCFAFVFRNAKRLGVGDASIDDVVQEVFLVVHRRLHDYDGRVPINGWIFGILSHVVRGHRRTLRRKYRPMVQSELDAEATRDVISSAVEPLRIIEQREAARLLLGLLDSLDDDKRELLVLSELEQLTVPEIAEAMGTNVNTVYSRVKAAKKAFAEVYARETARAARRSR